MIGDAACRFPGSAGLVGKQAINSNNAVMIRVCSDSGNLPQPQPVVSRVKIHIFNALNWADGPRKIENDIHVWRARRSEMNRAQPVVDLLCESERHRAERYKNEAVRDQFVFTRGWLRRLLSSYLGLPASEIPIVVTPDGKPVLSDKNHLLYFNVSHTQDVSLFAFGEVDLGVDVEADRTVPSLSELVNRFFHVDEQRDFQTLPFEHQQASFLRAWTCKEAILKGVGCGSRKLDACRVSIDPAHPIEIHQVPDERPWRLVEWQPYPGYYAALAAQTLLPLDFAEERVE